jgi:response regulator RpfG family c-di-GMP phosphodiesterase
MTAPHDRNLEALIYSDDQWISARCAEAFAELPVDWVRTEDSTMASKLLSTSSFDFVILDLDSPLATALLPQVRTDSSDRRHAVVLGITGGGIDADILEMSYESLIFYPVRPEQICSEVHRAMPLAERVSKHIHLPVESSENSNDLEASGPTLIDGLHSVARMLATKSAEQFRKLFAHFSKQEMRHSLSIVAQERAASLISAAGTIWYVHEITRDWTRLAFLVPATGPTQLIGVATLLWLCAKYRRATSKQSLTTATETN